MTIVQFITISIKLFIAYFIITESQRRDLKGRLPQKRDYESVWSPESLNTMTTSGPPTDYENTNVDQMVATTSYENTNVDQMVATNYENASVGQTIATSYENANVNQMVVTNYENVPPQNSSTYESVRLPDSSHIYDALRKEETYK